MTPETIKNLLALAAQHATRFRIESRDWPQRPQRSYEQCKQAFDRPLPEKQQPAEGVIGDLVAAAEPGLMMATGARFHGWVIGGSHPVGVAADFLTTAWGQNAGNHIAAPAAAAAETIAARWLLEILELPSSSSVGFVTGATVANFVCLAAARGEVLRRVGWDIEEKGLFGAPPITVLIGDDAHTTVFSALQFLGIGHHSLVRVPTDHQGQIVHSAFAEAIGKAKEPIIAIMQAGQINTGGFDNFAAIIPRARAAGAWIHVDGAFGLWAKAGVTTKNLAADVEMADSWATDGHKWLQTPYDSGYAIVRDELTHRRAMTIAASYLPMAAEGERDPTHYVPELSRRARGFATWAMLRHLGRAGIAEMVERHCRVARLIAEKLSAEPGISILNDVVLNQVIVRFGADDEVTIKTIARIQQDGVCFAGGAKWRGQQVMRISVIGYETTEAEGLRSAEAMIAAWRSVNQRG